MFICRHERTRWHGVNTEFHKSPSVFKVTKENRTYEHKHYLIGLPLLIQEFTERGGRTFKKSVSHSGGSGFISRPGDWQFLLRFLVALLSPSRQMRG
jgi:hypothetical protein